MKRFLSALALFSLLSFSALALQAQEKEGEAKAEKSGEMAEPDPMLKWANFAILALALGYLLSKTMPPLFRSRTDEIQQGIAEAQKIKAEADKRVAEVEARLKTLSAEIEQFRTQAKAEMQQEGQRLQQETAHQIARLEQQASQEIDAAGKTARRELKSHAANLAVTLAEQKLRAQAGSGTGLVDGFLQDLSQQNPATGARN